MIGVCGLFFFIVGYALVRKDLAGSVTAGVTERQWRGSLYIPCSGTMVGCLTKEKSYLLETLGESIFAGHGDSLTR